MALKFPKSGFCPQLHKTGQKCILIIQQLRGLYIHMKELLEPTPKEIRDLRLSIDLTQEQAGNLLHVSTRHFRRWETGNTQCT